MRPFNGRYLTVIETGDPRETGFEAAILKGYDGSTPAYWTGTIVKVRRPDGGMTREYFGEYRETLLESSDWFGLVRSAAGLPETTKERMVAQLAKTLAKARAKQAMAN